VIAIDTETHDPDLLTKGSGWATGNGEVVGISLAVDDAAWYFPIRHQVEREANMDPDVVLRYLADVLGDARPKVGANLLYDVGWLRASGVKVGGKLIDVQFMEALLSENGEVGLEHLGNKYLSSGKDSNQLYDWAWQSYGGRPDSSQRRNIYRCPPSLVGPYAEQDARLPLQLAPILHAKLAAESLLPVFDIETRLIPLLIDMRAAGVSVDLERAEDLSKDLLRREELVMTKLREVAGGEVNLHASESLALLFDKAGVAYPRTAAGRPSFRKEFLAGMQHPVGRLVNEARGLNKLRGTFVDGYILNGHTNGKIHAGFHPLRGDSGGARSGRFSSSQPNLQNVPSRDEELAPIIRGLFVPDAGHKTWARFDYSQIEYRFFLHYAVGEGAEEMRAYFNAHPDTDFHERTLDLVAPAAGWDMSGVGARKQYRKPVKNVNFGLLYGMSERKLAAQLGLSENESSKLFRAYHEAMPFTKTTMRATMSEAARTGIITTILGRRSRFENWESAGYQAGERELMDFSEARDKFGFDIQRAMTHKALNRRLQGSAADLIKVAMVEAYESGLFNETGVPRLTVHDELDFSLPAGAEEYLAPIKRQLETAMRLSIPIKADMELGPDWGHLTST
jgi:DNA polymerase I-like protein with 3'-5' exonuclease and polymerase domains